MALDNRILIKEARKKEGKTVLLAGWVKQLKSMGNLAFITLRDSTGNIQLIVIKKNIKNFNEIQKLTRESAIQVKGTIKKSKLKSKENELVVEEIEILNKAKTPLPIDLGAETTNIDKRLDNRFLDTREEKTNAIFRIRSKIIKITTNFFDKENFININSPKLTCMGAESGAQLFNVQYFAKKAFLSQSPQIYKQMFVAGGFEKVYEIAPVFRAEKSHTTRHLTEFTGIDMEMGFIKDEHDIMDVVEELMNDIVKRLRKECKEELKLLNVEMNLPKKIPRITMKEAKDLLKKKGKNIPKDDDLDPKSEKILGEIALKKYKSDFIFITNYPWKIRPFYHMKKDKDGTKSFDLIHSGLESATGAQREHRLDILESQAEEKKISLKGMEPYLAIFKYGCPPHGGVGLGLDRIVQGILKIDNIRECILLPRDPERITP
jgi:nondiscriminating aspartyl-tRNA synthetase